MTRAISSPVPVLPTGLLRLFCPRTSSIFGGRILALVLLSVTTATLVFLCSGILYGLGFGMLQPSLQAWAIKRVTPENRGMANAMFINSIDFGVAVGSMLLGLVVDVTSNAEMYGISALFMVLFLILYGIVLIKDRIQSSLKKDMQG